MGIVARWSWVKEEVDFRVNRMCCYQFYFLTGSGIHGGWVVTGLAAVFLRLRSCVWLGRRHGRRVVS